jgi:hypothetical protein
MSRSGHAIGALSSRGWLVGWCRTSDARIRKTCISPAQFNSFRHRNQSRLLGSAHLLPCKQAIFVHGRWARAPTNTPRKFMVRSSLGGIWNLSDEEARQLICVSNRAEESVIGDILPSAFTMRVDDLFFQVVDSDNIFRQEQSSVREFQMLAAEADQQAEQW